jgi:sugar/nucleoside kinase (ribokinase family)
MAEASATVVSAEDLGDDAAAIAAYARRARLLVVTEGARGATVHYRGEAHHVPAFPTVAVDATGAGDVFAAAFFVVLARGVDPFSAARYASCAASFAVEQPGTLGIPTAAAIEERLARG